MENITITLPDGAERTYATGVTGGEIASDISKSLGKAALACRIDGRLTDLSEPISGDAALSILTIKGEGKDDADALELIRHDAAHIMARAVQEIWPETKVTIGPVIENGFYYDFDREEPFTPEDLIIIEKKMKEIINLREEVRTEVWERAKAIQHYRDRGEPYKVELIEAISNNEPLRMYWHGDWQDLCRGPHLQHTGQLPADAFKLMRVSGAYWRGDSDRAMLQRIYGTAWPTKDELRERYDPDTHKLYSGLETKTDRAVPDNNKDGSG